MLSFRKEEGTRAFPLGSLGPREDTGAWVWLTDASLGTISSNYLATLVGHMDKMENCFFSQGSKNHNITSGPLTRSLCWKPLGSPQERPAQPAPSQLQLDTS